MSTNRVHEHTLLIVESPTLARIIDGFRLPGLQTWSSGGYCWQPRFNPESGRLKKRANPGQREDRKRLKQLAAWSARIVVATDTDPSGVFLAEAIRSFLKEHTLYRGHLTSLSTNEIRSTLHSATPIQPSDYRMLERRRMVQSAIRKHTGNQGELLFIRVCILNLALNNRQPSTWVDAHGRRWRKYDPSADSRNSLNWYPDPPTPPTTLCLLSSARSADESFSDLQERIEYLFSTASKCGFPISYPRSGASGWHLSTWDRLTSRYQTSYPAEELLPASLRKTCAPNTPHEALHIVYPDTSTPPVVRPYLDRKSFHLYEHLHRLTTMPLFAIPHTSPSEPETLQPVITTSDLCNELASRHACSPSTIGKVAGQLVGRDFIRIEPGQDLVTTGSEFHRWAEAAPTPHLSASQEFISTFIKEGSLTEDEIETHVGWLAEIFKELLS